MYMTAQLADVAPARQCIGAAVADRPEGPFDPLPQPLVCQLDRNGSIDPRTFVDGDGSLWLHWKSDDNADVDGTGTASIYAQRLDGSGTTLLGEPVRILEVDQPWEGRIVEAPHMVVMEGQHWHGDDFTDTSPSASVAVANPSRLGSAGADCRRGGGYGCCSWHSFSDVKGEKILEKGGGDDPYFKEPLEKLKKWERDREKSASERERARRIRKQRVEMGERIDKSPKGIVNNDPYCPKK